MSKLNPAQLLSLALGGSVLYAFRAYNKPYKAGDWQNGMDFYSQNTQGYYSISDSDTLKANGYIEIQILDRDGSRVEKFEL